MPQIALTRDQLRAAIAEYLRGANVSALLNLAADAMNDHASYIAPREPGEASWVGFAAGRVRCHADIERRAEDDMFTDISNTTLGDATSVLQADAVVAGWLTSRGL